MPTQYEVALVLSAKNLASAAIGVAAKDLQSFEKQVATTARTADGLPGVFARMTEGAAGLARGLGTLGLAKQGLDAVSGAVQGLGGALGIGLAQEMEQARAKINAFTKDQAQTEAILKAVRTEADKTPFSFGEMAKAAGSLAPAAKRAGVDLSTLLQTAEALAAADPAQGFEGAVMALREAMSGDLLSLRERFEVDTREMSAAMKDGVPPIEAITAALGKQGINLDLVRGLAETTTGRMSTFQDAIAGVQRVAGEEILKGLGSGLDSLSGFVTENIGTFTELSRAIGQLVGGGLELLQGALTTLVLPALKAVLPWLAERLPQAVADIREGMKSLVPALQAGGQSLGQVAQAVGPVVLAVGERLLPVLQTAARLIGENLQPILITLAAFLGSALVASIVGTVLTLASLVLALNPVTLALGALLAAVFLLAKAWTENWGDIQGKTKAVWDFLNESVFPPLAAALAFLKDTLLPEMGRVWVEKWEAIQTSAKATWDFLNEFVFPPLGAALAFLKDTLLPDVAKVWGEKWTAVQTAAKAVWDFLNQFVFPPLTAAVNFVKDTLIPEFARIWGEKWEAVRLAVDTVWNAANGVKAVVEGGIAAVMKRLTEWVEEALAAAKRVGEGLVTGIKDGLSSLGKMLDDSLLGPIKGKLEEAANAIKNWRPPSIPMPSFSLPGRGGGELAADLPPISPGVLGLPLRGAISQPYGQTQFSREHPQFYGNAGHDGIDIVAGVGTPVGSAGVGRVTRAGFDRSGYGNLVEVVHNGISTFYGHLDAIRVAIGDIVAAGQIIGTVGMTGNTTGPHLHLGARDHGRSIDPRSVIAYATGGLIREPVVGVGKSGRLYTLGENESEQTAVVPSSAFRRGGRAPAGADYSMEAAGGKGDVHHHYHLTFTGAVFGRDVEDVVVEAIVGAQRRGRLA